MFDITSFILTTLKGMIGNYPDFQVREFGLNWYSKGKLTEENLAEIEALLVGTTEDETSEEEGTEEETAEEELIEEPEN